ncbi:hypothetical protein [Nakamurella endophytica]|uniref:Uncharacterized protein n=1 Tax=Nakamurella endophytica TaxID=1748367 RepID=A0A917WCH7_9ACTN|nr:hypothetical protein [Nakamurella endophytica]GGL89896.1 hypothetical protein GCM10011594_06940 [Nakamurella endophytica]
MSLARADRRPAAATRAARAARWVLVVAVLAGIVVLHLLTDHHGASELSSPVPAAAVAGGVHDVAHPAATGRAGLAQHGTDPAPAVQSAGWMQPVGVPVASAVVPAERSPGIPLHDGGLADCVLALVLGLALAAVLVRRSERAPAAPVAPREGRARPGPGDVPVTLCVLRT